MSAPLTLSRLLAVGLLMLASQLATASPKVVTVNVGPPGWLESAMNVLRRKDTLRLRHSGQAAEALGKALSKATPSIGSAMSVVSATALLGVCVSSYPQTGAVVTFGLASGYDPIKAQYKKNGSSVTDDEFLVLFER